MAKKSGKRNRRGRPKLSISSATVRKTITLTRKEEIQLRLIGAGNLSAGVRRALALAKWMERDQK